MQVGSLVICLTGNWCDSETLKPTIGPKLNEICTISGFPKKGYITLEEYPQLDEIGGTENYAIGAFRELQPPMEIDIEYLIKEPIYVY